MRIEAGDDATTTTTTTAMTRRRRRGDDTAGRRGDDTTTRTECCHRNVATEPRRCGDTTTRRRRGGDDDSLAAAAAPTCLHNRCGLQLPSARSSSLQPPSLAAARLGLQWRLGAAAFVGAWALRPHSRCSRLPSRVSGRGAGDGW